MTILVEELRLELTEMLERELTSTENVHTWSRVFFVIDIMKGICKKFGIFISVSFEKRELWGLQNNNIQINDDLDFLKDQVIKHTIILRSPTLRGFFWKTNIAGWSDRKKKQQKPCQNHIKGLDLKVKNMIPSEVAEPHPKDSTSLPVSAY